MKKKYTITLLSLSVIICTLIIILISTSKTFIKKDKQDFVTSNGSLVIMISEDGTNFTRGTSIPSSSDGNYYLADNSKCEAKGSSINYDNSTGKVTVTGPGQNQCYLYFIKRQNYTVTYAGNGSESCNPSSKSIPYNNSIGTLCAPTYSVVSDDTAYSYNHYNVTSNSNFTFNNTTKTWYSTNNSASGIRAYIQFKPQPGTNKICYTTQTYSTTYGSIRVYLNGTTTDYRVVAEGGNWDSPNNTTCYTFTRALTASDYIRVEFYRSYSNYVHGNDNVSFAMYATLPRQKAFGGWYRGQGIAVSESNILNADTTIYPNWGDRTYGITYSDNVGTGCDGKTKRVVEDEQVGSLCTPTRSGYYFRGWFTSAVNGTQITSSSALSSSIPVYAVWSTTS